jgi:hypothetical protein
MMKNLVVGTRFTSGVEHFVKRQFHSYQTNAFVEVKLNDLKQLGAVLH